MLTYTFSLREKILLAVLAFVAIGIAWYVLIFSNIQARVASIESEIAITQDELTMAQTQAQAIAKMKKIVEQYGGDTTTVTIPDYDNTQNLMAFLNGVLDSTEDYTMSFEDPVIGEETSLVQRAGTITYKSNSYDDAHSVVEAIAHGPYPCRVDAVSIDDKTESDSKDGAVTTTVQVTYLEKPTENTKLGNEDTTSEGNDWSVYMDK